MMCLVNRKGYQVAWIKVKDDQHMACLLIGPMTAPAFRNSNSLHLLAAQAEHARIVDVQIFQTDPARSVSVAFGWYI